jgi:hypothetical protein
MMSNLFLTLLLFLNASIAFSQELFMRPQLPRLYQSAQGVINIDLMEETMATIYQKTLGESISFHIQSIRWTYDPMGYINYGLSAVNSEVKGTRAEYTLFFTSHESGNHQVKCRMIVWNGYSLIEIHSCHSETSQLWTKAKFNLSFKQVGL